MSETADARPPRRPFRSALLWLPIAGVALGQRFVLPGTSIADLALAAFSAFALLHLARAAKSLGPPRLPSWAKWLAALWAWAVVGGVAHALLETDAFSFLEFSKSFAKLSFYAVAAVALHLVLREAPPGEARRIALTAFAAAGAAAVLIYAAMLLQVPLPYHALWGHGPEAAYFNEQKWFGGAGNAGLFFLRAEGLASEPSRLGYLQAMALAYLLLRPGVRPGLRLGLILLSLLLTFSLTAYALLLPILLLALLARRREGRLAPGRRGLALSAALLLLLLPLAPTLYRAVVVRASRMLSGSGDASSFLRVSGNWEMTYGLLETNPVLGVGLGNYDVVARELQAFLFEGRLLEGNIQGWNAFAYVLATTGVPGLLLLVAMLVSAFRGRGRLAVPFVLGMFADGTFLGAAFWVFFALYTADDA